MPSVLDTEKILTEIIVLSTYIIICIGLSKIRVSKMQRLLTTFVIILILAAMQTALILSGKELMFLLTMIPVTVYLPVSTGIYLLSERSFFQTAAAYGIGWWAVFTLKTVRSLLFKGVIPPLNGKRDAVILLVLLVCAVLCIVVVYQFLRKPFESYVTEKQTGWLFLSIPLITIFLLFSYYETIPIGVMGDILLLAATTSIFFILVKMFTSSVEVERMKQTERQLFVQMERQKREYEKVCQKNELNRIYRHDTRHHLAILERLAKKEDAQSILEYLETLSGQLLDAEYESYCENAAVNALLSAYIENAKNAGCKIQSKINLPKEVPFDETDICMVFANILENAVHACAGIEDIEKRYINIDAKLVDNYKLFISIKNSVVGTIEFDEDGFPMTPDYNGGTEEHGIGLRSVKVITEKYNGFFKCECDSGEFYFKSALFGEKCDNKEARSTKNNMIKKLIPVVPVSLFLLVITVCYMPVMAGITEGPFRIGGEKVFSAGWGYLTFAAKQPVPVGGDDGEADVVSGQSEQFISRMQEEFLWYAMRKYEGYVSADVSYEILRDDDKMLSVRFFATINVGGSVDYSRCILYDKQNREILELKSLFKEDSDYIAIISDEIFRQMAEQNASGKANYFIPGGIWSDDECFKEISADQNFYIDEQGGLVIVFDEYEVAPGSMGMPEFVIDTGLLKNILKQPSYIGS